MSRAMKMKSMGKKDRAKRAATDEHGNVQYNDETKKTKSEEKRAKTLARIFFWMMVGPSVLGGALSVWSWLSPSYTTIEVDDSALMRDVFFSGKPWLIMCAPYPGYPGNDVFESLAGNAWTRKEYRAGMIDCNAKLPASGKTVVERFRLNSQKGYNRNALAFWVANGGKPKVVPSKMLLPPQTKKKKKKSAAAPVDVSARAVALDEYVAKRVAVRYGKATNAGALKKGCLSKPKSAVVLSEGEPSAGTLAVLERLVTNHRTVKFCLVDNSKYKISVGKKSTWNKKFRRMLSAPMEDGEARLVLFLKNKKNQKKSEKKTSEGEADETKKSGASSDKGLLAEAFTGTLEGPPSVDAFLEERLALGGRDSMHEVSAKKVHLRYRGKNWKKRQAEKKAKKEEEEEAEEQVKDATPSSKSKKKAKKRRKAAKKRRKEEAKKQERRQEQRAKKEAKGEADAAQKADGESISAEQREREARRRREMDREAEQNYAQAADDYEDDFEDDDGDNDDDDDDDVEEVVLEDEEDEEEDIIDLDEM